MPETDCIVTHDGRFRMVNLSHLLTAPELSDWQMVEMDYPTPSIVPFGNVTMSLSRGWALAHKSKPLWLALEFEDPMMPETLVQVLPQVAEKAGGGPMWLTAEMTSDRPLLELSSICRATMMPRRSQVSVGVRTDLVVTDA